MKRVIVFLLLVGLGLAALWALRSKPGAPEEHEMRSRPAKEGQFSDIPTASTKVEGKGDAISVKLDGAVDFTQRTSSDAGSTLKPELTVHANDVDQLPDDVLDMHGLSITVFDKHNQKKRAEMRSPLSRVKIARKNGTLSLPDEQPIELTNVLMTLFEGGPVAPLDFDTTKLEWKLADMSFATQERVNIRGKGLVAEGLGMKAGANSGNFDLLRDASIRLDLEKGQTVTLRSGKEGGVFAKQVLKDGQEFIDIVASGGAILEVASGAPLVNDPTRTEPIEIRATRVHMLGKKTGREADPFEIVSADADGSVIAVSRGETFEAEHAEFTFALRNRLALGKLDQNVVLMSGNDTFRSDHAQFEFDAKGDLERSTLTGHPQGDVEIGRFLTAERPELSGALAHLEGRGPLVVTREEGDTVTMSGPVVLTVPNVKPGIDLVLHATEKIVGHDDPKTKSGRLDATGAVVLDFGVNKLTSDTLAMSWQLVTGAPVVLMSTTGVTTLDVTALDGRKATTVARGGLGGTATKEKLTITEARDVSITSAEEGGLNANANIVRDFDPEARTFMAEGDVKFSSLEGTGSADRIAAISRDDMRMFGSDDKRARFDFARGAVGKTAAFEARVEAVEIAASPTRVTATRRVTGSIESADGSMNFSSESFDVTAEAENKLNPAAPRSFNAHVQHDVTAKILRGEDDATVTCQDLVVEGTFTTGERPTVVTNKVHARTDVHVDYVGRGELVGDGDEFTLDENGLARLAATEGRQVRAKGKLVGTLIPFAVDADWIEVDREHFAAQNAKARLDPPAKAIDAAFVPEPSAVPASQGPGSDPAVLRELRANMIRADRSEISLIGDAHVEGATFDGEQWRIDAGSIRMQGKFDDAKRLETKQIASIDADGGFRAVMGERLDADGETLHAVPDRVRVEGTPAHMTLLDAEWQSSWIQYDTMNMLLSTDRGALRSKVGAPGMSWSIEYESMQPFDQDQKTILVMRNPRFRFGADQLFAEWTLFWVDREEWRNSGKKKLDESVRGRDLRVDKPVDAPVPAPPPAAPGRANMFLKLPAVLKAAQENTLFKVLSELYIEGNIEGFSEGERTARASAIYLDIIDTQGWIQDADVSVDVDIRGFRQRLRARTGWMRIAPTPDGPSLRAENAEITSCEFDHPHYVIETGDMRITPKKNAADERVAYSFSTRKNRLRFENGLQIPLPSFTPDFDREGKPLIDRLVLGNSAKYGAAIRATLNDELGPVGKAAGRTIGKVLKIPDIDLRGNWHYNLGILGSRGVLAGIGIDFYAGDKFHLETEFDGIPDRKSDRGLVRVEEDDRSLIRTWFRARTRYTIREGEWVDVAFSRQSDAGVQSEFFERDYLRYETKDNYVHWRKAKDEWYFNASAKTRLENRRDVDELPSLGAFRGRTRIGYAFDNPIYYSGRLDAAYLRRRDGDERYYDPFEDGLGRRDVLRIDTEHKVEAPFSLGVLSARGTPYATARSTFWNEGAEEDAQPARSALIVGFDATTTFWKRFSGGSVHTISPTIGVHTDIVSQESGGDLILIDRTEDPLRGQFIDFGLRSRWWVPDTHEHMDVSIRASSASDLPDSARTGLQPIQTLADYLTYFGEVPVGMTHDARYDTRSGNTTYSLSSIGFEPWQTVGVEFGYQRGLSTEDQVRLFESASVAARWRWTPKWELEAGQSYAIAEGTGVGNSLTLRRLGHDFVIEIEVSHRSGEGSAFNFNFQPRISWKRSGLGLLDRWLGMYH